MTATASPVRETEAQVVVSSPEVLSRLAALHAPRPVVVSAYVRLGVDDRTRNRYLIAMRDAIRRIGMTAGQPGILQPERQAIRRDLDRIESYLSNVAGLPHCPGLALFGCESLELFEVVPLPRVLQTRLLLGVRPRLAEAIAAVGGFGRVLVAMVDRTHARFFEVTAFEAKELPGLALPATRGGRFHSDRADSPGWGERDFHNRIREERHRRAAAVAHQLSVLVAEGPCQGIVLAGAARAIEDEQRFLPLSLASRVLGTARLNPTSATVADVHRASMELCAQAARARETALLAEIEQGIGTGWAVNGARPTLRALARGQLRLLAVPAGQGGAGYRCALSGRLVVARGESRGEGEPVPVPDLVSEAIDEALRQRAEVAVIEDPERRAAVDGLAGLLRFR